jgi:hypothetical protein
VSVEHKRPLLAFLVVALICGMVIGRALASQAVPVPAAVIWSHPAAVIEGAIFPAAEAAEPVPAAAAPRTSAGTTLPTPAAVAANGHASSARANHGAARHAVPGEKVAAPQVSARGFTTAATVTGHGHAKGHAKHHAQHRGKGHGRHGRALGRLARWSY